jgi:hypothetical protein
MKAIGLRKRRDAASRYGAGSALAHQEGPSETGLVLFGDAPHPSLALRAALAGVLRFA